VPAATAKTASILRPNGLLGLIRSGGAHPDHLADAESPPCEGPSSQLADRNGARRRRSPGRSRNGHRVHFGGLLLGAESGTET
jgi:hypothetical protein